MSTNDQERATGRYSRRKFLGTLGVGAGAAVLGPGQLLGSGRASRRVRYTVREDRFGRIFSLPRFAEPSPPLETALREIGRPGNSFLDAHDALDRGPVDLIVDPALSVNNPNNPTHTAGTTFVGQFLDHDMTFDTTSQFFVPTSPEASPNARTPRFDLDSVYGGGPSVSPVLYERSRGGIRFRVESGGLFEDLPRAPDHTAIIPDPRNDENLIISGLHAAFLLFHNHVVDRVVSEPPARSPDAVFDEARRLTIWHYQWMILHEFLPLFVGQDLVDDILRRGRRFYTARTGEAFIPVEFQGAAYRFGHSMVRPSYRANLAGDDGSPFFAMIFDGSPDGLNDLRGGQRARRRFVGWQTFFDFGDGQVKPNKRIDTKISTPLHNLPLGAIVSHDLPTSLPQRNLLRQVTWSLPSGQAIAAEMRVPAVSKNDFHELKDFGLGLDRSTPLWYYVLKEAELMEDGLRLGPVGGGIVAEVFIGLLQTDPGSYLSVNPSWQPTLPRRDGSTGDFRMIDFLTFAGVDPTSRGQ